MESYSFFPGYLVLDRGLRKCLKADLHFMLFDEGSLIVGRFRNPCVEGSHLQNALLQEETSSKCVVRKPLNPKLPKPLNPKPLNP